VRRRLVRLVALSLLLPAAAQGAAVVADRLEAKNGPSTTTRSLRQAANLAARQGRRRWR
jgi:hypothetical protein